MSITPELPDAASEPQPSSELVAEPVVAAAMPPAAPVASAPGPFMPAAPIIQKQTYASPTSYVGSARRITAWIKRTGKSSPVAATLAWSTGIIAILLAWAFVTVWYVITVGIFGVLTIPYRFIRRGHRKQEHLQKTQLATMQAMLVQQQQAMLQNNQRPQ